MMVIADGTLSSEEYSSLIDKEEKRMKKVYSEFQAEEVDLGADILVSGDTADINNAIILTATSVCFSCIIPPF
ncbi:hypothetical protein [Brevibacillus laterosporus]|uniref:Uncharacterized protein n=1 Tax=Brevibacillus laterosporus TaxID=1465 RepID=A0A0F6XZ16_BRELA|nr:hypothetical protein EX87_04375 [Brevibacillus laterosporus]